MDPFNCSTVRIQRMVSNSGAHERDQQSSCRRAIQGSPDCDGMGFRYRQFRVESQSWRKTPGGSVATRENHNLSLYVSPILEKRAVGMVALSRDWNSFKTIYLFPPIQMMPQVLKLESLMRLVVLVVPY